VSGRSLVRGSLTDCVCVCECGREASIMRPGPLGAVALWEKDISYLLSV
jgi:hypothetical protein